MKECDDCGFNEEGMCICWPSNKWYACPIESSKPENIKALEDYAKWVSESEVQK